MLLPLRDRWRYGLIDPDEPWPHEENEKLAEIEAMQKFIAEAYNTPTSSMTWKTMMMTTPMTKTTYPKMTTPMTKTTMMPPTMTNTRPT